MNHLLLSLFLISGAIADTQQIASKTYPMKAPMPFHNEETGETSHYQAYLYKHQDYFEGMVDAAGVLQIKKYKLDSITKLNVSECSGKVVLHKGYSLFPKITHLNNFKGKKVYVWGNCRIADSICSIYVTYIKEIK